MSDHRNPDYRNHLESVKHAKKREAEKRKKDKYEELKEKYEIMKKCALRAESDCTVLKSQVLELKLKVASLTHALVKISKLIPEVMDNGE